MQLATDLSKHATEVRTAQRHVDAARSLVANDKQARASSLAARLADAFFTTQPEAVLNDAEARLATATENGRAAAHAWIVDTARQGLADQPADAERHREQGQRLERVQGRAQRTQRWLKLAQVASSRLSAAQDACESASTSELLDMVTTSKAISTLSWIDTSDAADAIKSAGQAVKALTDALPKRADQSALDLPDDFLDFVVDLVFDPGFDVLSWFNMQRLDDAATQCKQAASKLRPLLDRLGGLSADSEGKVEQEVAALRHIETPYLEAAAAQVPDVLRVPTPTGFVSHPA